ncbi:MAG: DUF2971 domain-containing protein [Tolumonas sp.]|nr:DUF2971 domain-containing protein [Tolumonas sp.]
MQSSHIQSLFNFKRLLLGSPDLSRAIKIDNKIILDAYVINGLKNNQIFYSAPIGFNDPYEAAYQIENDFDGCSDIVKNILKLSQLIDSSYFIKPIKPKITTEFIEELNFNNDQLNYFSNIFADILRQYCGVLCLTPNLCSIPMWAYYGDNHQGIALEFERNDSNILGQHSFPINYIDSHPKISLSKLLAEVKHISELDDEEKIYLFKKDSEINKLFYSKHESWEKESEWRTTSYKSGLHDYPAKLLSITFGLNTPDAAIEYVKDLMKDSDILFKYMVADRDNFKIYPVSESERFTKGIWTRWHPYKIDPMPEI